ncbi:MAG: hypothetical protein CMN05_12485 [Roseibacillus sp.]|jgi:hypothetical protein|nr:hypothetical protein [Roseibacillus sp.]MBP36524.1 hypothetical protein [Roseibacillus sp.]MCP4729449.1 hypothetical protein [Roseibacillus sp.]MDP6207706.1 hypothetical protein [Roseibacillus sp.]MDP7307046.1 hypothetical protein [Roseibacillus sp.]|tara:strand:- start:3638 stop:4138 length:501 start_codon:yes stop_codon:yes gene_type:complete
MKIQPESSEDPPQPMANPKSELRNLRNSSSATVAELKSFLKQLQGRSPQEMLGIVAASQLFRAICISTIIVLAGGLILTAIPFAAGAGKPRKEAPSGKPGPPSAAEPAIPRPASDLAAPSPPDQEANPLVPTAPNLSNLGVTEEKQAPPNKNPLENEKDNFLDGLE